MKKKSDLLLAPNPSTLYSQKLNFYYTIKKTYGPSPYPPGSHKEKRF